MFFGARTPFRPQLDLNMSKKATGMLIKRAAKLLSYLVFYSRLSFVKWE